MAAGEAAGRYRSSMSKSKDPSGLLISVIRALDFTDAWKMQLTLAPPNNLHFKLTAAIPLIICTLMVSE